MFYSAVPQGTHGNPKNCLRVADTPVECSKLGKTRIIADAKPAGLEMPHFLSRIFICILSEIEGMTFSPYNFPRQKNGLLKAAVPYFLYDGILTKSYHTAIMMIEK